MQMVIIVSLAIVIAAAVAVGIFLQRKLRRSGELTKRPSPFVGD